MNTEIIEKLTTNRYKVLKIMYDNQIAMTSGPIFTPLTQIEIAKFMGVSKITMNAIFKEMQKDGLIYPYNNSKGRYCLSKEAVTIIEHIEALHEY